MTRASRLVPLLLLAAACTGDDDPAALAEVSVMAPTTGAVDAALSADGTTGYYVGERAGMPVVGIIDAQGARELVRGAPFGGLRGIAVHPDGYQLVADEAHDGVFIVDGGQAGARIAATAGTHPRALEVDGDGVLHWGGEDAQGVAVFALDGQAQRVVARDPRFTSIGGLAIAADGTVYVADDGGTIFRIAGEAVTVLAEGLRLGDPAGVALTGDDATLLVSSLDAAGQSQVVLLDTATGAQSTFNDVIGANAGAGGLHRAQDAVDQFIWVSRAPGAAGTIYRVDLAD